MTKAKGKGSAAAAAAGTDAPLVVDSFAPSEPVATAADSAPPAAWQHIAEDRSDRAVRGAGLAIAILLFAVAAIIALYNVMRIASIWFEPRFVPIVQFILASAVMFGCYAALRRLKR